ncbi:metalloregulator ArsR/SmtB family transcription factor [Vibrio sp. DW001]|jgi:DNA-binding transcriptional ArsR family regulator|uniref:ArsR/SmtB family transcription factor n=1 Tax=unclassified Vibrio TaxID=2614977 RepID=UPI00189C747E|nr:MULTISPECIES: metalloregulator ArsR/SmtB family transcription factor [unclassified Vibrio]UGA57039.1 metalloregulator ArsR/SmtB family transcription factor [Vibrio sp. VB16]WED29313.1 metalloregulator ArsR/SmtB family transcription factor [Vibrio sp. DW001]
MELIKMQSNAVEMSELLKTMAHPERLMVLCQLMQGELGAGKLQEQSSLSQSAFSQHLTVLRKHGLVNVRKESQQVFYSLSDERVGSLIASLHQIYCV